GDQEHVITVLAGESGNRNVFFGALPFGGPDSRGRRRGQALGRRARHRDLRAAPRRTAGRRGDDARWVSTHRRGWDGTLTFWDATPIVRDPGKGALRSAE